MKKILGYFILLNIIPIILAFCTLNGKFCHHGSCEEVIPFWGGYFIGWGMVAIGVLIILIGYLVEKYLLN